MPWISTPDGPDADITGTAIMTFLFASARIEAAKRIAVSFVGAVVFAAIAVSAAAPIVPIA